uniref:serine-type D-Ala-D-Ala carboxypeptidase n=1 Tax=Candidatus Kentrum sp. MB TaxID=2138164 RepID=A0A450XS19_9GAMM|nr:MAG: D-alanyl-D-alanine carboxypeptidase (penicillin-binding protein 5/6) [Candidatus Kentron sp. MB]VFK32072.1 MAG: D-alanyl-D-alanine carboxypeptidase (penicillin-binding protein 5/6) [Candidatus Kentron sp. MB]VFK75658.1 MAG: D-alanyl-D-alanine carboxypeptidase (penicillin-binding protein 5/6) [Candidatus Kentron sp. MB]
MHMYNQSSLFFWKTLRAPLFLFFILYSCLGLAAAQAFPPHTLPSLPNIDAKGYILQDAYSNTVLAEQDADARMAPASLTKMMTVYVIFSELRSGNITPDEDVLISEKAWRTSGSRTFLEVGNRVPVHVLLKGIIVQSGNDASVALAEHIAGDESAFAARMNQQARRLGLAGSHFVNASGLPAKDHYTTARDMAQLGAALIRDFPNLYKLHAIKSYEYNNIPQYNRNKLLWRDDTVDGIKTGYTKAAGYCLVASAWREGMRLVSVVMGTNSVESRTKATQTLLNYGFRFFKTRKLYDSNVPLTTVRVWKGRTDILDIGLAAPLYITLPRQRFDQIKAKMEFDTRITAPIASGEAYGTLKITLGDEILIERPVISLHPIQEGGIWRRMADSIVMYFD